MIQEEYRDKILEVIDEYMRNPEDIDWNEVKIDECPFDLDFSFGGEGGIDFNVSLMIEAVVPPKFIEDGMALIKELRQKAIKKLEKGE